MSKKSVKNVELEAEKRLSVARIRACAIAPFMQEAVYFLIPMPGKLPPYAMGVGVTDKGVMIYDPEYIVEHYSDVDLLAGAYLHEADHIARGHAARGIHIRDQDPSITPQNVNLCGDLEINDDLRQMGVKLSPKACFPHSFNVPNGKTMEQYLELLRDKKPQGSKGKGDDAEDDHGPCNCGSGAGNPLEGEDEVEKPEFGPGEREAALEGMRERVAKAAIEQAKQKPGTVPAGWKRWADERVVVKPIPWEQRLSNLCRRMVAQRAGYVDTTYMRRSKLQSAVGFGVGKPVLHGYYAPIPSVALVQDTSGSIGDAIIQETMSHAADILRAVADNLIFVACDASVHTLERVTSVREMRAGMKGGGGTDFRPAFDSLQKLRPDIVVFATDTYGTFPEHKPKWCEVIWLVQGGGYYSMKQEVPWGHKIVLDSSKNT